MFSGLEERLGVRLLHRTTRRYRSQRLARHTIGHCARIVAEAESAEQAARALQREPRGMLPISAPDTFGPMHVAPAIPEFLARFPGLAIDMSLSPRHVDLVQEGLDLAIRIGTLKTQRSSCSRLAPSRFVLCAAPACLDCGEVPRDPD